MYVSASSSTERRRERCSLRKKCDSLVLDEIRVDVGLAVKDVQSSRVELRPIANSETGAEGRQKRAHLPARERAQHRRFVHNAPSRSAGKGPPSAPRNATGEKDDSTLDKNRAVLHLVETGLVEEAASRVVERKVERDDVGSHEELVQVVNVLRRAR